MSISASRVQAKIIKNIWTNQSEPRLNKSKIAFQESYLLAQDSIQFPKDQVNLLGAPEKKLALIS